MRQLLYNDNDRSGDADACNGALAGENIFELLTVLIRPIFGPEEAFGVQLSIADCSPFLSCAEISWPELYLDLERFMTAVVGG
jgi:hypothetical protein